MKYQVSLAAMALMGANCVTLNREPLLTWAPTPADPGHPKDYFVPHLGADSDMVETKKSISTAET